MSETKSGSMVADTLISLCQEPTEEGRRAILDNHTAANEALADEAEQAVEGWAARAEQRDQEESHD